MRSFAFIVENITSDCYSVTPVWTFNVVRFEKRAAKTLQHVHKYDDIVMLYGMINTYKWFPCNNWPQLYFSNKSSDFSSTYCFLVKYVI